MWCLDLPAEASDITKTEVVGQDNEEIGALFLCHFHSRRCLITLKWNRIDVSYSKCRYVYCLPIA